MLILEKIDILDIKNISGSSIGSLLGALYGAGYKAEELYNIIINLNFKTLLNSNIGLFDNSLVYFKKYGIYT